MLFILNLTPDFPFFCCCFFFPHEFPSSHIQLLPPWLCPYQICFAVRKRSPCRSSSKPISQQEAVLIPDKLLAPWGCGVSDLLEEVPEPRLPSCKPRESSPPHQPWLPQHQAQQQPRLMRAICMLLTSGFGAETISWW